MKIEVINPEVVICDGNNCRPLDLYDTSDECGSCPIIELCERFIDIKIGI